MNAPEPQDLSEVWAEIAARLPPGWELEGLRCASTGLAPDERSSDWIAVAVGPGDEETEHRAGDPIAALRGLVESTLRTP
jgi:hypothetical protein